MEKKHKFNILDSLTFLFPSRVIRTNSFTKKDVRKVKGHLVNSFSYVYAIVGAVLILLVSALSIYMRIHTNNHFIETYGFTALLGQWFIVLSGLVCIAIVIIAHLVKKDPASNILNRIAGDVLFIGVTSYMLCCIHADAEMGYTTQTETLSASIIFVAVLVLIQPQYWIDALVLNFGVSAGILGVSTFAKFAYGMKAVYYYGLISLIYPFGVYLIIAILFYAECQHYKEFIDKERLTNKAYYDELTQCKNRYSLQEYLKENKNRWNFRENLNVLMVLFDIDDFKKYNDQFSHLGGDYCLKSIADAIRREFPSPSLDFFRYGGEEFLLFFEIKDHKQARKIMNEIKGAISTLRIEAPEGAPKDMVTISVGGIFLDNLKNFDFEEQLRNVDVCLYKAKTNGKDVCCLDGKLI